MSQPIDNLYLLLSAPTATIEADFAKASAAGDAMAAQLTATLGRLDASFTELTASVQGVATEVTTASERIAAAMSTVAADSASMAARTGASADEVAAANGRMAASFEQGVSAAAAGTNGIAAAETELSAKMDAATAAIAADQQKAAESFASVAASAKTAGAETATAYDGMVAASAKATESTKAVAAAADEMSASVSAADTKTEASNAKLAASFTEAGVAAQATADKSAATAAATASVGAAMSSTAGKATELAGALGVTNESLGKTTSALGVSKNSLLGIGVAAAGAGYEAVKMAGDYQQSTTRLVTGAGLVQSSLDQVRQGILNISQQTGTSTDTLSQGMYKVSSAGFNMAAAAHDGANGLKVLQAAAEGAKAGNADLVTVADAVSTALLDYHKNANDAADVTSKMVAAEQSGKMTFEEMAASLNHILPQASAAHVSFGDIMGDLAAMTVHGMSAQQASENLAHALQHLQTTTAPQRKELAMLGIDVNQLSHALSTKGLSGAVNEVSAAIEKRMGKSATDAIVSLNTALATTPPKVQALGKQLLAGSITASQFLFEARSLDFASQAQAQNFLTLAKATHGLGTDTKSASEIYQTYSTALKAAMGDQTGLNVALMIGGQNSNIAAGAIKNVSGATAQADGNVKGWSEIQGNFNQKMSEFTASIKALAISVGTQLLPTATAMISKLSEAASWLTQHKRVAEDLAYAITAVLGVAIAGLTLKMLDLITRPIRALPGALADFASWVGRMTAGYGDLTVSAEASALKRGTAESEAATAADVAATRTQEAAVRMQAAYDEMAIASEGASIRIVAADATASVAAEGEAAAGAASGGLMSGAMGLLGPIGAVVGGSLLADQLSGGKLTDFGSWINSLLPKSPLASGASATSPPVPAAPPMSVWDEPNKRMPTGWETIAGNPTTAIPGSRNFQQLFVAPAANPNDVNDVRNLPHTLSDLSAKAQPKPPANLHGMYKAPNAAAGDKNDARNLHQTLSNAATDAQKAAKPVPGLDALTKLPPATPGDIRGLAGIVGGAMDATGATVDAKSPGMAQKMKDAWNAVCDFGADKLAYAIGSGFGMAITKANDFGKSVNSTLSGIAKNDIEPFFTKTLPHIVLPQGQPWFEAGHQWATDFGDGVNKQLDKVPGALGRFFSSLASNVFEPQKHSWFQMGNDVGKGFGDGVNAKITEAIHGIGGWVGQFVQGFKDHLKISSPSQVMHDIGDQTMMGFGNGIIDRWNERNTEIGKIPGILQSMFNANAGSLLSSAGIAVMNGFVNAAENTWNAVSGFFSGIAGWIAQHKGPIEVDRQLLVPHGHAIMEGLVDGLAQRMPALRSQLDQIVVSLQTGDTAVTTATNTGAQIAQGLAAGIDSHSLLAASAVTNMVNGVHAALGALDTPEVQAPTIPSVSVIPTGPVAAAVPATPTVGPAPAAPAVPSATAAAPALPTPPLPTTGLLAQLTALASAALVAGRGVLTGFAAGVTLGAGNTIDQITAVIQQVRDLFPSPAVPARSGPFSGTDYTDATGLALITDWATGILAGQDTAVTAATQVSDRVHAVLNAAPTAVAIHATQTPLELPALPDVPQATLPRPVTVIPQVTTQAPAVPPMPDIPPIPVTLPLAAAPAVSVKPIAIPALPAIPAQSATQSISISRPATVSPMAVPVAPSLPTQSVAQQVAVTRTAASVAPLVAPTLPRLPTKMLTQPVAVAPTAVNASSALTVDAGAQLAQGIADGMTSRVDAVRAAAQTLAEVIRGALGQPVSVTAPALPALPVTAAAPSLVSVGTPSLSVANAASPSASAGVNSTAASSYTPIAPRSSATTTSVVHNHYYDIAGSVWSLDDLYRALQTHAQQHGIRNTGAGFNYGFGSGN